MYMGILIMKLLSDKKKKKKKKKHQMLYNKSNATYNILINHLFLVPLPKRNTITMIKINKVLVLKQQRISNYNSYKIYLV